MTVYELLMQFDQCRLELELDDGMKTYRGTAVELLDQLVDNDLKGTVIEFTAERDGSVSVAYHKAG